MMPKYLMATKAYHQLGDISRDKPSLCRIISEDENNYIGSWVEGFGFINVKFPKETTRELTNKERKYYAKQYYQINSGPSFKLNIE